MRQSPEMIAYMMEQGRLPSSSGRGFRSRRGAPQAEVKSGLQSGSLIETNQDRDRKWGDMFNENSVYGGRPGSGDPYGTARNPVRFTPAERERMAGVNRGISGSQKPFMPSGEGPVSRPSSMPPMSNVADYPTPDFSDLTDEGISSAYSTRATRRGVRFGRANPVTASIERKYGSPNRPGFLSF